MAMHLKLSGHNWEELCKSTRNAHGILSQLVFDGFFMFYFWLRKARGWSNLAHMTFRISHRMDYGIPRSFRVVRTSQIFLEMKDALTFFRGNRAVLELFTRKSFEKRKDLRHRSRIVPGWAVRDSSASYKPNDEVDGSNDRFARSSAHWNGQAAAAVRASFLQVRLLSGHRAEGNTPALLALFPLLNVS